MKNYHIQLGILTGIAAVITAAQPAHGTNNNQVTDIEFKSSGDAIELELKTSGDVKKPTSFVTIGKGENLEANLLNTQLKFPKGKSLRQEKPLPGIAAVEISQVDKTNVRVVVEREEKNLLQKIFDRQDKKIGLSLVSANQTKTNLLAQLPTTRRDRFSNSQKPETRSTPAKPVGNATTQPNVMISNPEVSVQDNGKPTVAENQTETTRTYQAQSSSTEPEYLPRAVAPPVGDMSVSNINAAPDVVDLNSSVVVPRLVLRDAPVREVLSLLARSAGLNIVFTGNTGGGGKDGKEGEAAKGAEQTISLDLENEPVQAVFNSVLLVANLQANRQGNIIYVGEKLPTQARNLVSRTLRLNQVSSANAAAYLASQGAEAQKLVTEFEEVKDPETGRVISKKEKPAELKRLTAEQGENGKGGLLLNGLSVATDDRLNAITLIGEPRKVEVATTFLTQLDARRRQVAINVRIVDVNLLNQDKFNSSFSFGVDDSFFVQDNGAASMRFGSSSPVSGNDINSPSGRVSNPPAIPNPFAEANVFHDFSNTTSIPGTATGLIDENTGEVLRSRGALDFFNGVAGVSKNPFKAGFTDVTVATFDKLGADAFTEGTEGTAKAALASFFQYPKKFLSLLEAQITSGNAKILTDPTLVVQEGQQATVKLVQNILESVKTEIDTETGARTIIPVLGEAGLSLTVNLERIDDNGFISLSVSPTIKAPGNSVEFDSGGGATNFINLVTKREVSSGLIRLRDDQTLILSGIIQDTEKTTIKKVPILGDIPLLGSLFRSTQSDNQRNEVIVLLTPQIMEDNNDSQWGFNYNPSKEASQMLKQQGFEPPVNP